jgi:hypothetical protein
MTSQELDRLWARPSNWTLVYRCAEDPRVIVPRRRRWMGWTVNFARPQAWLVVAMCVVIAVGPFFVSLAIPAIPVLLKIAVLVASICGLVGLAHWEASRSRE